MSENRIKVFISGACPGLGEVRTALAGHPEVEIVGMTVDPAKAQEKIAQSGTDVVLHGVSRSDHLPDAEIDVIRGATAAPIILLTSASSGGLLREALAAGIQDVVLLPQLTDALVFTLRKTTQLADQRRDMPAHPLRAVTDGRLVTVFSPKGGVGKTTLACAVATAAAKNGSRRVLLVDLDLQFGDTAIMMGVDPDKTIYDLVLTSGDLDADKLSGYVTRHPSGVDVLPAPVRPDESEAVVEDRVARLLDVAKEAYDVIVVDTPAHFQSITLATLDRTDKLLLVAALDIPTVKSVKLTLQTLALLHYPVDRISLILNRAGEKAELKKGEVEKALDLKVAFELPLDRDVPVAVNRGVPITLLAPKGPYAKGVTALAVELTGAAGPAGAAKKGRTRRRGIQAPRPRRRAA